MFHVQGPKKCNVSGEDLPGQGDVELAFSFQSGEAQLLCSDGMTQGMMGNISLPQDERADCGKY